MPAGAGMGVDRGAIPGNRKMSFWYEAAFHRRQDSRMIEELLQPLFKVKRDIFSVHESFFDHFGDFGFWLLCFLLFSLRLLRLPAVP